jgi:hypothetical protein
MQELRDIRSSLELSPGILRGFVDGIPMHRIDERRSATAWTLREHVEHLAEVQPMLYERLRRFRDEEHPDFTPYMPDEDEGRAERTGTVRLTDHINQFEASRRELLELLDSLPREVWDKQATHPEYSEYTAFILVRHILLHDHWHMYRMEELLLTRDEYLTELH